MLRLTEKGLGHPIQGFILYPLGNGRLYLVGGMLTGNDRNTLKFRIIMLVATWRDGKIIEKNKVE